MQAACLALAHDGHGAVALDAQRLCRGRPCQVLPRARPPSFSGFSIEQDLLVESRLQHQRVPRRPPRLMASFTWARPDMGD